MWALALVAGGLLWDAEEAGKEGLDAPAFAAFNGDKEANTEK